MKHIVTTVLCLQASNVFAATLEKDMLVAVMEDYRGAKSMHRQMIDNSGCTKLLENFKQLAEQKQKMQLTLENPPFSGYVVELFCIRPDGTTIGKNGIVPLKDGLPGQARQ